MHNFTHKRELGICIYLYICECFTSASMCQSFKGNVPSPVSMQEAHCKLILKILAAQVM